MKKLLRSIVVPTIIFSMAMISCLAFVEKIGMVETKAFAATQSAKMVYKLKASMFPKSGVIINDKHEFERIRMGHQIGIGVVKIDDNKEQDIKNFNYKFGINGVDYPKVVTITKKRNFFILSLPYGVEGKAKLEVENKNNKAEKGILEFDIDNKKDIGDPSARVPYRFEKANNLLSVDQQKLEFSYNKETGKYTIILPKNPLKDSQKKFFKGWKVTDGYDTIEKETISKVYSPLDKAVVYRKCEIEPVTDGSAGNWAEKYGRWVFYDANGDLVKNTMRTINGNTYKFDQYGIIVTGWVELDGNWYYFNKEGEGTEGAMVNNQWKKIEGKWYYFHETGKMASDENIGEYYVNKSGAWVFDKWIKSDNGKWWYSYGKGGYAKDGIVNIDGKEYYFDQNGWMATGWIKRTSVFDGSHTWYYFNKKGEGTEGAMVKNQWKKIAGEWYYFHKSADGINTGKAGNGWMATGWLWLDGNQYYLNEKGEGTEGAMVTGWKKIEGKWYYFYETGKMAKNTVINGYKVDDNGVWVN